MVAFPALAAVISLACALVVGWDGLRRLKPDKLAWAIAFALFALAAGAEVVGSLAGWTPLLVRTYYLAGAVLVVGYLALGELYLLAPNRVAAIGPGAALLVTAVATAVVLDAPIDAARLAVDGWEALERGPALIALAATVNGLGTLVVVGGAAWSAWRFWRRGGHRHRMIGCLLIAGGTLVVAAGGTLTRFGHHEYLYVAMAAGVALIFAGYLEARRPAATGSTAAPIAPDGTQAWLTGPGGRGGLVPLPGGGRGRHGRSRDEGVIASDDPAIAFVETQFMQLDGAELAAACRVWSVERTETDHFDRAQAQRVWALRLRLSPVGQVAFDALPPPARLQLAELYHEVLAPGVAELAAERRASGRTG